MATKSKETIPKMKSSKIIGIQFSILSPDEIRKGSVAEITSRDTYINNKPVIGGLFDPRMGVLEPGLICPTDGLDYMQTPGYFGHIEMARPVFYIQYLTTIMKILKSVCIKCSKLKISKENYKQALKMSAEDRWVYLSKIAANITRCGEDTEDGCGCLQPKRIKKEGLATLFAEWDNVNGLNDDDKETEATGADIEIMLSSVNVDAVQEDVRDASAVDERFDVKECRPCEDVSAVEVDVSVPSMMDVSDAVRDERTEVSYAVRDERTEMKFDAIRDVCTDAVHDGRTEMIAVRDERTVYADRDDRTEEMMKNAVRDGRTEKSAHDVYDDVGTDGTILKSVESIVGNTTETAFVMNYDSIDSDTDDDERTYDLGSNWAKTSTMVNLEQGGVLDGDIFGARSFTGMSLGATTEHESDVSRTEVEENSHDTTTVINSQIRI